MELLEEIWKPVVGFEGLYEVSNFGKLKSLDWVISDSIGRNYFHKGKIINGAFDKYGYLTTILSNKGKENKVKIHRLIGMAFIPNPLNKSEINHKNGIKHDNRLENLEWATSKENVIHSINILGKKSTYGREKPGYKHYKLNAVHQFDLSGNYIKTFESTKEAAQTIGTGRQNIERVLKPRRTDTWTHKDFKTAGGFIWSRNKILK